MPTAWPQDSADGRFRLHVPVPEPRPLPHQPALLAGAAEVDITPPPGMPKAGHSRNAHDGTGFRTRLKARVVHLRYGEVSLALVACDLLAGSALVHRALADELAAGGDTDVPAEGLFLGATHTHAGPGQYSGSEFYNHWAANRPGFDPGYARFLIGQLVAAVREAVSTRTAARAAIGTCEVWGLTRNRSLGAHVRNADLADRRTTDQRKYAAIDPRLHLLRVDRADGGPLAAYTWFSIHGTGISHHDTSYHADVWAYLNRELADRVEAATGSRPVSAAAVASHGDMTPAVRPGMLVFPEAERVGRGIGSAAAELHQGLAPKLRTDFPLRCALREVELAEHPTYDGITLPGPRIGTAKAAGAVENQTPVLRLVTPFRPGHGRSPRGPHAEKRIAGSEAGHPYLVGPEASFPHLLPVQLVGLADRTVVGVPFETTVEAGRRIAARLGPGAFVSSLANDHCDYLTTREEYAAQFYEGGSTVFGPRQQEFVAAAARRLADDLGDDVRLADLRPRDFDFTVGHHLARPTGETAPRSLDTVRFVEATPTEDAFWELTWADRAPGDLCWHEPLVRVEAETDAGWATVVDDQGWHLGVTHLGRQHGTHRYAARWYAPPLGRPGRHRFVLEANAGQPETPGTAFD
ncbi:MAG: neutral/alkaline non-lysosomal ceramidase N-terminal domain-containing protein [Marmoricola sp.]